MWFVFPQIAGLGFSATAREYGIAGLDEARAHLAHPGLGPRLRACAEALASGPSADPVEVLGPLDAPKLRSSMTLFARAADDPAPYRAVLNRFYAGAEDDATVSRLS